MKKKYRMPKRVRRAISCTRKSIGVPGCWFDLAGGLVYRRWEDGERCQNIRSLQTQWKTVRSFRLRLVLRMRIYEAGLGLRRAVGLLSWAWTQANEYVRHKLLEWRRS